MEPYDLKRLIPAFEEAGRRVSFVAAAQAGGGADRLLVDLGGKDPEAPTVLEMLLVPGCSNPEILQLFVLLSSDCRAGTVADVCRLIVRINNELPVAGLGLIEDKGLVFFRHLQNFFPETLSPRLVLRITHIVGVSIASFWPIVRAVASGGKSYRGVLPDLERELLRIREFTAGQA